MFVNVEASKSVEFKLVYQEVLQRRLGRYEHVINIDPGQIVPGMKIVVNITESRPINKLSVPLIQKEGESPKEGKFKLLLVSKIKLRMGTKQIKSV